MRMALKQGEPAMRGARRVVIDHIERAIHTLQQHTLADEPLHEARKQMKRTRAGLRLLRDALGETAYRRLNRSARDPARPLTPIRDAKVLRDALANVLQRAGKSVKKGGPSELRQALQQEPRLYRDKLSITDLDASCKRSHTLRPIIGRRQHVLRAPSRNRPPVRSGGGELKDSSRASGIRVS